MKHEIRGNENFSGELRVVLKNLCCVVLILCSLCISPKAADAAEPPGLKEQFEKKISQLIGLPVSVAQYSMEYATVRLKGVTIGDSTKPELPMAQIKELSATCDLMSLLGGNLVLKEITVASLSSHLTLDSSGNLVMGDIPRPATSTTAITSADLPFNLIRGNDLVIMISDTRKGHTLTVQVASASLINVAAAEEKSQLRINASFSGTSVESPMIMRPLTGLQGSLVYENQLLKADNLSGNWGPSAIKVSGQVNDLKKFALSLRYTIDPLDLTDLGKIFLPPDGYTLHGSGLAEGKIDGFASKASITGTVRFSSCNVAAPISTTNKSTFIFPFQNVVAIFRYQAGTLAIESAHAGLFGGMLSGKGTLQPLKKPATYQIEAQGQGIQAESFLAQNTSQKQVISGPVNATLQASGDTTGLASWNGKGDLNIQNGRYQAPPVITPVLSLVNLKEFASGDINAGNGTFTIRDGVMTTDDLTCLTTAGKAFYRGNVGLDTSLNGQLNLAFSQTAVQQSQALQQISLDGITANIPTRVGGTLLAPTFPGFSAGKLLELGLKRKGQKMLQDLILPGSNKPAGTEGSPEATNKDPGKELLDNLQNIFRKKKKSEAKPLTPEGTAAPTPQTPAKNEDLLKKELKKLFKF